VSRRSLIKAGVGLSVVGGSVTSIVGAEEASAWGGHENGRIPLSALTRVPWSSYYLETNAANALVQLNASYKADFGHNVVLNDGYRNYDDQVDARSYWCSRGDCKKAAVPGESNHGWARAIDLGIGMFDWQNPTYLWFKQNAGRYGWVHPAWAEPDGWNSEAWHWEYEGSYSVPQAEQGEQESEDVPRLIKRDSSGVTYVIAPGYLYAHGDGEERRVSQYLYGSTIYAHSDDDFRRTLKAHGFHQIVGQWGDAGWVNRLPSPGTAFIEPSGSKSI
jgi:hypothetical protein